MRVFVLFSLAVASGAELNSRTDVSLLQQLHGSKVFSQVVEQLEAGSPADDILQTLKQVNTQISDERKQIIALKVTNEASFFKEISGNRKVLNATRTFLGTQVKCVEEALETVLKISESQELSSKNFVPQVMIKKWEHKAGNISRVKTRLDSNYREDNEDLQQRRVRVKHAQKLVEHVMSLIESHYAAKAAVPVATTKVGEKVQASLLELAAVAPDMAASTKSIEDATKGSSASDSTGTAIMDALGKLQGKFEAQMVMLEEEQGIVTRDYEEKKVHLGSAYNETIKIIGDAHKKNKATTLALEKLREQKKEQDKTKAKCSKKMASLQATEKKDLMALQESKASLKAKIRIYDKNLEIIQSEWELSSWVMTLVMKRVSQIRSIIRKSEEARLKETLAKGEVPLVSTGGAADVAEGVTADADVISAKSQLALATAMVKRTKSVVAVLEAATPKSESKIAAAKVAVAEAEAKAKDASLAADDAVSKATARAVPESNLEKEVKQAVLGCPFSKTDIRSPCFTGSKCEHHHKSEGCQMKTRLYCVESGGEDPACMTAMAKRNNITVCATFEPVDPNVAIDTSFYREMCEGKAGQAPSGCTYRRAETGGVGTCLNKKCLEGARYWCQDLVTKTECRVSEDECKEAMAQTKGAAAAMKADDKVVAAQAAEKQTLADTAAKRGDATNKAKADALVRDALGAKATLDATEKDKGPSLLISRNAKSLDETASILKERALKEVQDAVKHVEETAAAAPSAVFPAQPRFAKAMEGQTMTAPPVVVKTMLRHNLGI